MKYTIVFLILLFPAALLFGQDLIVTNDDEEIIAKIVEIKKNRIVFLHYSRQDEEPQHMPKEDVYMIIFEDGMKQFFADPRSTDDIYGNSDTTDVSMALFNQGMEDASLHFDDSKMYWIGCLSTAVLSPMVGIPVSGVYAAIPPEIHSRDLPDEELYTDPNYMEGYQKQAHKMKVKEIARGVGTVVIIELVFVVIMTIASS